MRASEAGNGLHRGRPHQAISTLLCTKQHGDLCVYFSSLQQCPTPGRLHSRDICCHIPPLVNKGTEAGDTGGFLSTAEYGVRWSSTVVSLPSMTAPQKGQRCPLPHTPPQYPVFITRKRCLMSLPAERTKGTATVNGIPVRLILLPGSSLKPYLSSLPLAKKTISRGSLHRKPLRKEKGGRWGGGAAGRERKKKWDSQGLSEAVSRSVCDTSHPPQTKNTVSRGGRQWVLRRSKERQIRAQSERG